MPVPMFCIEQHNGRLRRVPRSMCKGAAKGKGATKKRRAAPVSKEWGPTGINNNKQGRRLPIPSFHPQGLGSLDTGDGGTRSNLEDPDVQRAQLEAAEELHQANQAVRAAAKAEQRQAREAEKQAEADEADRKRQAEADDADKQAKTKRRRRLLKKAGLAAGAAALAGATLWTAKSNHPGARAIRERAANTLQEFSNDLFNQNPGGPRDTDEDDDGWIAVDAPRNLPADAEGPLAADNFSYETPPAPSAPPAARRPRPRPRRSLPPTPPGAGRTPPPKPPPEERSPIAMKWAAGDDETLAAMKADRDRPGIDDPSAYDEVVRRRRRSPPPFGGLDRTGWLNTQEDLDAFDREIANRVRLIPSRTRRAQVMGRFGDDDDGGAAAAAPSPARARRGRRRQGTPDDEVFFGRVTRRERAAARRTAGQLPAVERALVTQPRGQDGTGFLDNPRTVRRLKLAISAAEKKKPNAKRRLEKVKDDMLREILGRNNKLEQASRYIASLSA